jgi:Ca2+-binding RTX toxin-like protein
MSSFGFRPDETTVVKQSQGELLDKLDKFIKDLIHGEAKRTSNLNAVAFVDAYEKFGISYSGHTRIYSREKKAVQTFPNAIRGAYNVTDIEKLFKPSFLDQRTLSELDFIAAALNTYNDYEYDTYAKLVGISESTTKHVVNKILDVADEAIPDGIPGLAQLKTIMSLAEDDASYAANIHKAYLGQNINRAQQLTAQYARTVERELNQSYPNGKFEVITTRTAGLQKSFITSPHGAFATLSNNKTIMTMTPREALAVREYWEGILTAPVVQEVFTNPLMFDQRLQYNSITREGAATARRPSDDYTDAEVSLDAALGTRMARYARENNLPTPGMFDTSAKRFQLDQMLTDEEFIKKVLSENHGGATPAHSPAQEQDKGGYDHKSTDNRGGPNAHDPDGNRRGKPVLLDLTGNGINLSELTSSHVFFDTAGDGYKHRTAWAGVGNGVLAIDADNDEKITERKEIVFADWDPSAKDDMAALKAVFDTNDNGKLDKGDARFEAFRVLVTNADGTTTMRTLDELGISEIDLTPNAVEIVLDDGSVISGKTTFKQKVNGVDVTRTAAAVTFATEAQGYALDAIANTVNQDGTTIVSRARNADGSLARSVTTTTKGNLRTILFDHDGDTVTDEVQTIETSQAVVSGKTVTTEVTTVKNNGGILLYKTIKQTSDAGNTVSIQRDSRGGGYFDETELRETLGNGDYRITLSRLNPNGTLIDRTVKTTSADGLVRIEAMDLDGNGTTDVTVTESTVYSGGNRTVTTSETNADGSLRNRTVTTIDAIGQNQTTVTDIDGDGVIDTTGSSTTLLQGDGSSRTVQLMRSPNDYLLQKVITTISADGLSQKIERDLDNNGIIDVTKTDITVIGAGGQRTQTITEFNPNDGNSTRSRTVIVKSADGRGRDIQIDLDGNGHNDRTQSIVVAGDGSSVDTVTDITDNGSTYARSVTTSSADGLTTVTQADADGNGTFDSVTTTVKVKNANGSATTTQTRTNGDATLRDRTIVNTSASGLNKLSQFDRDGDAIFELTTSDTTIRNTDESFVRTIADIYADGSTGRKSVTTTSADRNTVLAVRDTDGDGLTDQTQTIVRQVTGALVDTVVNNAANGTIINRRVTTSAANGLSTTTEIDENADNVTDRRSTDVTTLSANGGRVQVVTELAADGSRISQVTKTTDDIAFSITTATDIDGDGDVDLSQTDVTTLMLSGSRSRTISDQNANGTLRNQIQTITNFDGRYITTVTDANGDGITDRTVIDNTTILANGGATRKITHIEGQKVLEESTTTTSADGRTVTASTVSGNRKQSRTRVVEVDGDIVETVSNAGSIDNLIDRKVTTTSANGLKSTTEIDQDGDGIFDAVTTSNGYLGSDGSKTTVTSQSSANGTVYTRQVVIVSDDELATTTLTDRDGDDIIERLDRSMTYLGLDGSRTIETMMTFADGSLGAKSTSYASRDGAYKSIVSDANGDGAIDRHESMSRQSDGSVISVTADFNADGSVISRTVTTNSANGLVGSTELDQNGDGVVDRTTRSVTTLNTNGSRTLVVTDTAADGHRVTEESTTKSANGLEVIAQKDLDGDSHADIVTEDRTVLANDGSRTRTLSTLNQDGSLRSQTMTRTSDDGLSVTTEIDVNGDGAADMTSTTVNTLGGMANTALTIESDVHGERARSSKYTSNDRRFVTSTDIFTGSVSYQRNSKREVETDGDIVETVQVIEGGAPRAGSVTTTSANGLTVTTALDHDGNGVADVTTTAATVLNADGSKTQTVTRRNAAGVIDRTVSTVSGNGLATTDRIDRNGDGTDDLVKTSQTSLNADGSVTVDVTETNTDGSQRRRTVTTTSGDRNNVTVIKYQNGVKAQDETIAVQANGDKISTAVARSATQAVIGTVITTTSANGLFKKIETKGPTGAILDTQTFTTTLNADGSRTETAVQKGKLDMTTVTTTSADGLSKDIQATVTGSPTLNSATQDKTILNADGSRTRRVEVTNADGSLRDAAAITTSDDGLSVTKATDVNGDGRADLLASAVTAADGSKLETSVVNRVGSTDLLRRETLATSIDGRTVTLTRDCDGDGTVDLTVVTVTHADGSVTETRDGVAEYGMPAYRHVAEQRILVDGSTRASTEFQDAGGLRLGTTTSIVSANALSEETTFDLNGDGAVDQTASTYLELKADGSTVETEIHSVGGGAAGKGALLSKHVTTKTADGSLTTALLDADGNGVSEHSTVTTVGADGSILHTFTRFDNKTGAQTSQSTISIGASGLTTISRSAISRIVQTLQSGRTSEAIATLIGVSREGVSRSSGGATIVAALGGGQVPGDSFARGGATLGAVAAPSPVVFTLQKSTLADTMTIFIDGTGSNQWVRTSGIDQVAKSTHFIDANGIDTWSWSIVSATLWASTSSMKVINTSGTIRIDAASKQRALDLGDNIFTAALGREMSMEEREVLGQYIKEDGLDEIALATDILASDEFTDLYGTLSDAAFVSRMFMNALGHLPQTALRDFYLDELHLGRITRADVLNAIAYGIESGQVTRSEWLDGTLIDTVSYQAANGGVTVDLANSANNAGAAKGDAYALVDNIVGSNFDDTLTGDAKDNLLTGGAGKDNLIGGAGSDTAGYGNAQSAVTVSLMSPSSNTGDAAGDTYVAIENLSGSSFDDQLTGDAAANVLSGGAGNDTLDGGAGTDKLVGGIGNDTYVVSISTENVVENAGEGTDTVLSTITYTLDTNVENLTLTGTAAANGTGNTLDNVITGNGANNSLIGAAGNDTLSGGLGADTLNGGAGNDVYIVDNSGDVVTDTVNIGVDEVRSSIDYTLGTNIENLILLGAEFLNGTGNALDNVIIGNAGNNDLSGEAGDDTLDGKGGVNHLYGGQGNDTYIVDNDTSFIVELISQGTDTVRASVSYDIGKNDHLENVTLTGAGAISASGNAGANVLTGNAAANTLNGNDGNDTLIGGGGADSLVGGNGSDTASYENAAAGVTVSLATPNVNTGDAAGDSYSSIENLTGSAFNDRLSGDAGANVLAGGKGDDTYVVDALSDSIVEAAGEGSDTVLASINYDLTGVANVENITLTGAALTATGNTLANIITGTSNANTLLGNDGNDTLIGGGGADSLSGGAGSDTASYVTATAAVSASLAAPGGNTGDAAGDSYALIENLAGSAFNDKLTGDGLVNVLTGGDGDDILDGGAGIDSMIGGKGDDTFVISVATDVVTEAAGEGVDTVQSSVTYTLATNVENLVLTGATAINGTGNASHNLLTGNAAANSLSGAAGNDTLDGGAGNDTLLGGTGDDTYVIDAGDTVTESADAGIDTIKSAGTFVLGANIENLTLTGSAAINGTGNTLANEIVGNDGANVLTGGGGNDTLKGGAGIDSAVFSGKATDYEITELATGVLQVKDLRAGATDGIDRLVDIENLVFQGDTLPAGGSLIAGGSSAENLSGDAAGNLIHGHLGNDILAGNGGDDVLNGGLGKDQLTGGSGNDTYVVDQTGDSIIEAAGDTADLVQSWIDWNLGANVENLTLLGNAAINGTGNSTANVLNGNAGNNILDGFGGRDTLIGGKGDDTYVIDSSDDVVTELAGEGTDTVKSAVSFDISALANLENVTLTGSATTATGNAAANILTGNSAANTLVGNNGNDTLIGGSGADSLSGGAGSDTASYVTATSAVNASLISPSGNSGDAAGDSYSLIENLTGSDFNDTLTGDAAVNVLTGGVGNDTLDGGAGADKLIGGKGDDLYLASVGTEVITESVGEGTDTVLASVDFSIAAAAYANIENITLTGDANSATGNALNNLLVGNTVADTLTGGIGADTLDGGSGNDKLIGGEGDDTYVIDSLGDVMTEATGAGTDTVLSNISLNLGANLENLSLVGAGNLNGTGNALGNDIVGNGGANLLAGEAGEDNLAGNDGNDTLNGGAGNDTLSGGTGEDVAIFTGKLADYEIKQLANGVLQVRDLRNGTPDGTDRLINIEKLRFTGDTVAQMGSSGAEDTVLVAGGEIVIATASGADSAQITTLKLANGGRLCVWSVGTNTFGQLTDSAGNFVGSNFSLGQANGRVDLAATATGGFIVTGIFSSTLSVTQYNGSGMQVGTAQTISGVTPFSTIGSANGNGAFLYHSSIDVLKDGSYVVTWSSTGVDGANDGIAAKRFAADGTPIGSTFTVNTTTASYQMIPSVTALDNGGFAIAWQSAVAGVYDIKAQLYNESGFKVGGEITLSNAAGNESTVTISALSGGKFVAVYYNDGTVDGSSDDVFARIFNEFGQPTGPQFKVNTVTASYQWRPDVTTLADGGFVVTWDSIGSPNDDTSYGISGQRYDSNGNRVGGEFTINTFVPGIQTTSSVTADDDGGFTVIWESADGTIRSQSFDGAGIKDGTMGTDIITGDGKSNLIYGYLGDDTLSGDAGDDVLNGGAGKDSMTGGTGHDTYVVDMISDQVVENAGEGIDQVQSSVDYTLGANLENLQLTGIDDINGTGNALANIIVGNEGNNVLIGGGGKDAMEGGKGDDSYTIDSTDDVVTEKADEGNDTVTSSINFDLTTLVNIENITLTGTATVATGNVEANMLIGTGGANVLSGASGNDTLMGGAGADILDGGSGTDTASYENAVTGVTVNLSSTSLNTGDAAGDSYIAIENLKGSAFDDKLAGTSAANVLSGGAGNDELNGNGGVDTMIGGLGNDTYLVDSTTDIVTEAGNEGIDTVQSALAWTLDVNVENLLLTGTAAINGTGNSLDNILTGNSGANTLTGDGGNDTLDGGAGADVLIGGVGNDTYKLGLGSGADTISNQDDVGNDIVTVGSGVSTDQLWFQQSGNDLVMQIVGTGDRMLFEGWYDPVSGDSGKVDRIALSSGKYLGTADVEVLRAAMSSFSPPPLGQTTINASVAQALAPVLAAAWH